MTQSLEIGRGDAPQWPQEAPEATGATTQLQRGTESRRADEGPLAALGSKSQASAAQVSRLADFFGRRLNLGTTSWKAKVVTAYQDKQTTKMQRVALADNPGRVMHYLDKGADSNARIGEKSLFDYARDSGHRGLEAAVRSRDDFDPAQIRDWPQSANLRAEELAKAVRAGDASRVAHYVERGADLNEALTTAVEQQKTAVVQKLLENPSISATTLGQAADIAMSAGDVGMLNMLRRHGNFDIAFMGHTSGIEARNLDWGIDHVEKHNLSDAALAGNEARVAEYIGRGADVSVAVDKAMERMNADALGLLIKNGVDPNMRYAGYGATLASYIYSRIVGVKQEHATHVRQLEKEVGYVVGQIGMSPDNEESLRKLQGMLQVVVGDDRFVFARNSFSRNVTEQMLRDEARKASLPPPAAPRAFFGNTVRR